MANDLQIAGITLPTPVVGVCPSTVAVDVINAGPDPASFPSPMTVCLDIRTSLEGRPISHYSVSAPPEERPLIKGAVRTFIFTDVQFPCATPAFVTATADCSASVPKNARTAPTLTVPVPAIVGMPWLWTDIRLGLQDSTGLISWEPGALCSGATCLAEVRIRNAGCAMAPPSVTTLEILDSAGQSIALLQQNTPSINAGFTTIVKFTTTVPTAPAGTGLTFRACADSKGTVTPQCSLVRACAQVTLPLATASAPKLTFLALAPIFPGQPAPVRWRIQNFCSDIGKATATISFQGNVLYTSVQHPVGLQDVEKGDDVDIVPTAAVAANFYKFGTAKLTLEITGTGADPGPYKATALVTVLPEPVSGTWAFTAPAPGTASAVAWKASYNVAGRLTNPAGATMTPSSIVLNESSNITPPVMRVASPPAGAIVPGGFGTALWSLMQTWSWIVPGAWLITGPTSGTFAYSITFAMQDVFGNAYPPSTSATTTVVVSVSGLKLGLGGSAYATFAIAVGLFVTGLAVLAGIITSLAAPAVFAAAGVAFGLASGLGVGALDPPVSKFDYQRVEPLRYPELPTQLSEEPTLAPLRPILTLLTRIAAMESAMRTTEARLSAARIDRERGAINLQSTEYRELRDSLLAAASQVPLAVVEAVEGVRAEPLFRPATDASALKRTMSAWKRNGIPAKSRSAWIASGHSEQQLDDIERALRTPGYAVRPIDEALGELTQAVAQIANGVQEASEVVLNPPAAGTRPEGAGPDRPGA